MALYIPSLQTMFVHVYRCGGTSIRHAIMQKYGNETVEIGEVHCTAEQALILAHRNGLKLKSSFAVIRNPYDWVISQYYFIRKPENNHPLHHEVINLDFDTFCRWFAGAVLNERKWLAGNFMRQSDFIGSPNDKYFLGDSIVDNVFLLENINTWWPEFSSTVLKFPKDQHVPIRIINETSEKLKRKHYYQDIFTKSIIRLLLGNDFIIYNRLKQKQVTA